MNGSHWPAPLPPCRNNSGRPAPPRSRPMLQPRTVSLVEVGSVIAGRILSRHHGGVEAPPGTRSVCVAPDAWPSSRGFLALQEIEQQLADLLGLLLLCPMAGAFDQMETDHVGASLAAHGLLRAWRLVGAPVAEPGNEH